MFKKVFFAAAVLAAGFIVSGGELVVASEGESDYVIVIPSKSSSNLDREYDGVAKVLKEIIKLRSGADMQICRENELVPGKKAIFIGQTAGAVKAGAARKSWKNNQYQLKAVNGNIYLNGDDFDPSPGRRAGFYSMRLGSVSAVMEFVKKFAGADFLYAYPQGLHVTQGDIEVSDKLNMLVEPELIFGIGRAMEKYYSFANGKLSATWYLCHGGHSHIPAIPRAKYKKDHPEYFAIVAGKRDGYSIPQYCLSNPKVQELIYKQILKDVDRPGVTQTQLAQTDGFRVCSCEPCKKFFAKGAGEALWKLHLDMADRLLKDRPGKSVRIIAYGPTRMPPKYRKVFPENVAVTIAVGQVVSKEYLDKWKAYKVPLGFDVYLYNWGEYHLEGLTPSFTLNESRAQADLFRSYGINALYFCGLAELPGLCYPVITYYLRAMNGDKTAPARFLEEFCTKSFGKGSAAMEKFYTLLYSRVEKVKGGSEDYTDPLSQRAVKSVFARNVSLLHRRYPENILAQLETLLKSAEKAAPESYLLKHTRREFDYLKLTAGACNAFFAYHRTLAQKEFETLANLIVARKKFINSLPTYKRGKTLYTRPEGEFSCLGNFPVSMIMENGRLGAPLKAPFTWDVEHFLAIKDRPSGRVLKAGDPKWQMMQDIFGDGKKLFIKEHPIFVRCRVEGENLIAEMRFDNMPKEFQRGTIEVRLQKDEKSPRYRLWGSSMGGRAGIHLRTKIQKGNDYSDSWNIKWKEGAKYKVMYKRITREGESPVTEMTIPLALFGGPAAKGEKRMIDFVYHVKQHCYTWEYNINLTNWRHRYTSIGTIEF